MKGGESVGRGVRAESPLRAGDRKRIMTDRRPRENDIANKRQAHRAARALANDNDGAYVSFRRKYTSVLVVKTRQYHESGKLASQQVLCVCVTAICRRWSRVRRQPQKIMSSKKPADTGAYLGWTFWLKTGEARRLAAGWSLGTAPSDDFAMAAVSSSFS